MAWLRHKFNAKRTVTDRIKFSSRKESQFYENLKIRKAGGEILFFLRQVPFHLSGGVRYVVDFVAFTADGSVHFYDVKGMKTAMYVMKKKMVEAEYPIEIEEV